MAAVGTDRREAIGIGAANYCWTYTTLAPAVPSLTAEQWLRCVWEEAPKALRVFLRFGWRFGLGLRLGPADPSHVLGWHIDASSDPEVVISARSPIISAQNTLTTVDGLIRWRTDVRYEHFIGRLIWLPAAVLHQRIVPWSVRRTIRS